jgi:hypothetical protein
VFLFWYALGYGIVSVCKFARIVATHSFTPVPNNPEMSTGVGIPNHAEIDSFKSYSLFYVGLLRINMLRTEFLTSFSRSKHFYHKYRLSVHKKYEERALDIVYKQWPGSPSFTQDICGTGPLSI